jgi:hypothetical protein
MQLGCWIAILALFSIFTSLVLISSSVFYTMLGEVNARSSRDEQIGIFFIGLRYFLILRRHAQLFPESRNRRVMWGCAVAGFIFFFATLIVAVACLSRH